MTFNPPIKAIALLSGGLDSMLAVKVIQDQGISVTGVSFKTPFFTPRSALSAARQLGIKLIIRDITYPHLEIVKHPPHGYGKAVNPCIDCHGFMFKQAGKLMEKMGYDFIFTGEVLGERPMSQNRQSLDVVAKLSGYKPVLLRPLSARLLEITEPEQQGKVDREKLLDLKGRGRKRQLELAAHYQLSEFPTPAGGCLLTEQGFGRRLKDLLSHDPPATMTDIQRLKVGRHYRFGPTVKCIVGRKKAENELLVRHKRKQETLVFSATIPGPYCILTGPGHAAFLPQALALCASYGDHADGATVGLTVEQNGKRTVRECRVDKDKRYPEKRL